MEQMTEPASKAECREVCRCCGRVFEAGAARYREKNGTVCLACRAAGESCEREKIKR